MKYQNRYVAQRWTVHKADGVHNSLVWEAAEISTHRSAAVAAPENTLSGDAEFVKLHPTSPIEGGLINGRAERRVDTASRWDGAANFLDCSRLGPRDRMTPACNDTETRERANSCAQFQIGELCLLLGVEQV